MNAKSINAELLKYQEAWENKLLKPHLPEDPSDQSDLFSRNKISRPFCFGVMEEFYSAEKKIMVVGQQTGGWQSYQTDLETWPLDRLQKWGIKYLEWNLGGDQDPITGRCRPRNRSPFWNFFRRLNKAGWTPAWNNLDKIQSVKEICRTDELREDQEKQLNKPITDNGKTLLQIEIELTKPDRIVFVVGPRYLISLSSSMGLNPETLESYTPSLEQCCVEITDVVNLGIPVFWTYHPAYLNRHKGKIDYSVNMTTR